MIDFEKLDRLEEQAATANDTLRSLFARYRARIASASDRRRAALARAQEGYKAMTLAELATVNDAQLKAAGVDLDALTAAFRDLRAGADLLAEHERQAAANNDAQALLHTLRVHAGRDQ